MTDDIDAQPVVTSRHNRTYQFCLRCGMVLTGVTCGFCKDLKMEKPEKMGWGGRGR